MRRYRIVKKLGDGSQGVAYLAIDTHASKDVVLKKIPAGNTNPDEMRLITQTIKHPNIVSCFDSFVENDFLYMVLSYCPGGDLDSYLQLLKEEGQELPLTKACQWFSQLASALQYCHDSRTLHRDVKPSNVFLDKHLDNVYLGDFGVAKRIGSGRDASTSTFVGSPVWLSPEVISGEPYSYASDAWGLGCVLYELVAGYSPFDTAGNLAALVMKIGAGEYEPLPSTVPSYVQRCVRGLLTVNTHQRWTIRQALNSCDEFRNAAFLVDVPAAPTPRGTYHPNYASLAQSRGHSISNSYSNEERMVHPPQQQQQQVAAKNTSTSSANPSSPSAPVIVPSLTGLPLYLSGGGAAEYGKLEKTNDLPPPPSNTNNKNNNNKASGGLGIGQPSRSHPPGLNTWMRNVDDDYQDIQKQLGKIGVGGAGTGAGGGLIGGGGNASNSYVPPLQPAPRTQPQVTGPTASSSSNEAARVTAGERETPQPYAQAPPRPQQQQKGLNTWMRGVDDDFADLQRQLGKIGGAEREQRSGGVGGSRSPPPPLTKPSEPASAPLPVVVAINNINKDDPSLSSPQPTPPPNSGAPVIRSSAPKALGLNTWMRGVDDDFADLQRQLGKIGGSNNAVPTTRPSPFLSPPPPAPQTRTSAADTPSSPSLGGAGAGPSPSNGSTAANGSGKVVPAAGRVPPPASTVAKARATDGPSPTSTKASPTSPLPTNDASNNRMWSGGGDPHSQDAARLASPIIHRDAEWKSPNGNWNNNRNTHVTVGTGGESNSDNAVDTNKWVRAKNVEIAEIEAMMNAFKGKQAIPSPASATPPTRSRDVSPQQQHQQGNRRVAAAVVGGRAQPQPQPHQQQAAAPSAYQERLRKAQAAAEAKQRKAEEEAKAKEEAGERRRVEKEKEAAANAEKEERMRRERQEREENRSKALREFMQVKKEGRKEVLEHGVQHEVHVAGEKKPIIIIAEQHHHGPPAPAVAVTGGASSAAFGGVTPPPPFAGRRAAHHTNSDGVAMALKGGGGGVTPKSAGTTPQQVSAGQNPVVVHFGRRQSPAPALDDSTSPNQHQRPASGPSVVQSVPNPTAPRNAEPSSSAVLPPAQQQSASGGRAVNVASLQQRGGPTGSGLHRLNHHRASAHQLPPHTPTKLGGAGVGLPAKRSPIRGGGVGAGAEKDSTPTSSEDPKSHAAEERRRKLRELREGMLAQMQKDRDRAQASGTNNNDGGVEIVLPGNLKNLPQNKV